MIRRPSPDGGIDREQLATPRILGNFPLLFCCGNFPNILAFRPDAGESLRFIPAKPGGPLIKCIVQNRVVLAQGEGVTRDREIALYDPRTLARVGGLSGHLAAILDIDPHPSARVECRDDTSSSDVFLVSGSKDKKVGIYSLRSMPKPAIMFEGHSDIVLGVCFVSGPSSKFVCSCSNDCTIRLWDIEVEKPLPDGTIRQSTGVKCVRFHEGMNSVLACSYDSSRMYSVGDGVPAVRKTFRTERGSNFIRTHPTDSNLFMVGGQLGLITTWDIRQESRYVYSRHLHKKDRRVVVQDIVSLGQGRFASCASESDSRIRIWNEQLDPSNEFGEIGTAGKNFGLVSLVPLQPRTHPCAIGVPSEEYTRVLIRDSSVTVSSLRDELRRMDRQVQDAQKIAATRLVEESEEEGEGNSVDDSQVEVIQASVANLSSRVSEVERRMGALEENMALILSGLSELKSVMENMNRN